MLKYLIFLILFINLVKGKGEVSILSTPPGAFVKGHQKITEFDLLQLLTASLGFSVDKGSSFTGFHISNPFELASVVVRVSVDGVPTLGGSSGHVFPLKWNGNEDVISSSLPSKIEGRYPSHKSIISDINLSDGLNSIKNLEFLKESNEIEPRKVSYKHLKPTLNEDQKFIEEIHFLDTISQQLEDGAITDDFEPDYFAIKITALHAVSDLHGENSSATNEARQITCDAIDRLNAAFKKAYSGRVLFAVVTNDASHTRRIRQTSGDPKEGEDNPMNRAKTYSSDYPVIFNIILWFGVIMVFTLLAISLAIGNMDPGRDSIIYRMTSTRMKKDN